MAKNFWKQNTFLPPAVPKIQIQNAAISPPGSTLDFFFLGNKQGLARGRTAGGEIFCDWELVLEAQIQLWMASFLELRRDWALRQVTVGVIFFHLFPKQEFLECILGTLGDALSGVVLPAAGRRGIDLFDIGCVPHLSKRNPHHPTLPPFPCFYVPAHMLLLLRSGDPSRNGGINPATP